jgi:sialic acid synthase SpsE
MMKQSLFGSVPLFIAEIGNNHNGDRRLAEAMVDQALESGADYLKFQIYNTDRFIARENPYFDDFIRESLSFDDFRELKRYVERRRGKFLATPFDQDSIDLLSELDVDAIKISSGDMSNFQLLEGAAALGKPLIVSTGGASLDEIRRSASFLDRLNSFYCVLHCVISYPASFEELNLRFIQTLARSLRCPVGFSDHSPGIEASLAAVALGAEVIEKHFTIDLKLPGGDNEISVLPDQFRRLVTEGRNIHRALGGGKRHLSENERKMKTLVRRVIFAKRDIGKGQIIRAEDLIALRPDRPGAGLDAEEYPRLLGATARRPVSAGEAIPEDIDCD